MSGRLYLHKAEGRGVRAWPMSEHQYFAYRMWANPRSPDRMGYMIESGTASNDERHEGFINWIESRGFDMWYESADAVDFEKALAVMRNGGTANGLSITNGRIAHANGEPWWPTQNEIMAKWNISSLHSTKNSNSTS